MAEAKKQEIKEVMAKLRYLRQSASKVRLVAKSLIGLPVDLALSKLVFLPKASVVPLTKLIKSAAANAKHNFSLPQEQLFIKSLVVDQWPALKRFRPAAFGQAHPVKKHSCHVTVWLGLKTVLPAAKNKKAEVVKK